MDDTQPCYFRGPKFVLNWQGVDGVAKIWSSVIDFTEGTRRWGFTQLSAFSPKKVWAPFPDTGVKLQSGFTLIEVIIVMGFVATLSALATVGLLNPQAQASVDATTSTLVADLGEQQIKAMAGDSEGAGSSQPHGIYFEENRYTLFRGSSYSAAEPTNFVISLDSNMMLASISFPSSQVVFAKRSGEVIGYIDGSNSVTVRNNLSGEQKTVTVNRYGVVTVN